MGEDTNLSVLFARAMQVAASIASPEQWRSLCDRLGVAGAHDEAIGTLVACREAWEATDWGNDEAGLAFANLETALRLTEPSSTPAQALSNAAKACLRPWGLPTSKERTAQYPDATEPVGTWPPAARAMAVGAAYTDAFTGDERGGFEEFRRIVDDLVRSSGALMGFLVDAHGQLLAANGALVDAIDTTSLASLVGGGLASQSVSNLPTRTLWKGPVEGGAHHLRIDLVAERVILIVFYPGVRTGLVAVHTRRAIRDLEAMLASIFPAPDASGGFSGAPASAALRRITDDDLRNLFA